ncbi:uncharacterized MFS-type transporter C09D4.1 [Aethina tumida]|uniref:uncharacterized MFS-type transporter C09D4.1 n=1 Tax=Aethina tumida TaxID=116153 RepID=UPI00096B1165|nr:uncharacterized MFS-type transporter C09D4.1 [Aethina tumida]
METESRDNLAPESPEIKVYKYRWVMLSIFCLFTINNFVQFLEYSIIADIITKYYGVDSFAVDISGLIFFIMYLLAFLPISYLIEKYSMKVTAITSTSLTLMGNLVKLLSTPKDKFYLVIIGQGLCAIGQVYMITIPSKFAAMWFGAEEVSTACALAILGTQFGAALGSILPTLMVKDGTDDEVANGLMTMLIFHAVFSGVTLGIVILFFRSKPEVPPSLSQLNLTQEFNFKELWVSLKKLLRNKDFLIIIICFGMSNGLWNAFGIVLNSLYTEYFPKNGRDAGIIASIAIITGGCIGSLIFGLILDKTHQFKRVTFLTLLASSISLICVLVVFENKSRVGTFIAIPGFGFFLASTLVIGFEYSIEASYPIPESLSCCILNASIYIFAIINTLIMEVLFDSIGYMYSIVTCIVVIFVMSLLVLLMSSNLRRRDANLAKEITNLQQ